jgi:hypothetical protein
MPGCRTRTIEGATETLSFSFVIKGGLFVSSCAEVSPEVSEVSSFFVPNSAAAKTSSVNFFTTPSTVGSKPRFSATTVLAWMSSRSYSGSGSARLIFVFDSSTSTDFERSATIAATVATGGCFFKSCFIRLNPHTT